MASEEAALLRVLVAMFARTAFPEDRLRLLVSPKGVPTAVKAYNACDGTRTLSEVAREAGVDVSNLAKSVTGWVQAGIVHRIPDGKDTRLLHVYPISESRSSKTKGSNDASIE